ncbi:hypothetical protein BDP67DRAFT_611955 [Colletotrichum lupini]|nr:hypothetical protein BDP67DRAFT_611955 [Colletotrichum lupini]
MRDFSTTTDLRSLVNSFTWKMEQHFRDFGTTTFYYCTMERRTSITVRTTAVRVRKAERIPDHALPDGWAGGVCRQVAYFRKQDGQSSQSGHVHGRARAQLRRQGRHNTRWAVYYLRHRLRLCLINNDNGRGHCHFSLDPSTANVDVDYLRDYTQPILSRDQEDFTRIVKVELCLDLVQTSTISARVNAMSADHRYHGVCGHSFPYRAQSMFKGRDVYWGKKDGLQAQ